MRIAVKRVLLFYYREEILPIYERLHDIRSAVIARWRIGLVLLKNPDTTYHVKGREQLRWAFGEAEAQRYDFAAQIRQDVKMYDVGPDAPAG